VRTLNIELIRDPRTGRDISVLEAIKLGLFNSQTLTYYNPLTDERVNLNKAYERGFVIGHYTTTRVSNHTTNTTTTATQQQLEKAHRHEEKTQKSVFIVDVLDPRTDQALNLDEAIRQGLFDYKKGIYRHPVSGEVLTINEAINQGFINTASTESSDDQQLKQKSLGNKGGSQVIPVGDFGIDKQVKSIRTKFNKDGTSVLQIDIESTRPTKGIFEIDEIEEFTLNQKLPEQVVTTEQQSQTRQVVDINSVQTVRTRCDSESPTRRIDTLDLNFKKEREQRVHETEREIGGELSIKRIEDVVDDLADSESIIRRQITERHAAQLAEKPISIKTTVTESSLQQQRVLVIDDINRPMSAVNINGVCLPRKEELHINEPCGREQRDVTTELRRIVEETCTSELNHVHRLHQQKHHQQTTHVGEVPVFTAHAVVDLGQERREVPVPLQPCHIPYETGKTTTVHKEVSALFLFLNN
jgi:hypothetical protein